MIVSLTEEEAEYLRDRPFWDWQREEIVFVKNDKTKEDKIHIEKAKFYMDLYYKLGGKQ